MYANLYINTIILFLGFAIVLSGCSQGRTENTQGERRVYEAQVNEVDISILKRTAFNKEIISNGKLKALKKSDLKFKVSGELRELKVKNGQSVRSGQTIAVLDQFEYRQKLEHAETILKKTAIDLEDALLAYGGSQRKDSVPQTIYEGAAIRSGYVTALNDLKTARFNLGETILKAPFSGKIANIKQNVYEVVNTGEVFCTLIDDSAFEVEFHLIESEIGEVALNDKVKIIPFSKSVTSAGILSEINPLIDENGLVLVKATVRNEGRLWEGMNVKVLIEKQEPGHLTVPKTAVVLRQNQEVLFKYKNGVAFWTYIQTGLENSTSYSVIAHPEKGGKLKPGDTIIISNNLNLAHESKVMIRK
jgi:membrane fusion protein (multidrug efflux system)